jgi:hypothetical protein
MVNQAGYSARPGWTQCHARLDTVPGKVKIGTVPVFRLKHFEENNYLPPVPLISSYRPVKDSFVYTEPYL